MRDLINEPRFYRDRAVRAQTLLASHVVVPATRVRVSDVELAVGVDVGYSGATKEACAAAVAYSIQKRAPQLTTMYRGGVKIPYIPGLLAFREAPLMIKALRKLIDALGHLNLVVMVNGHGLAHPRGFGIASHIGVVMGLPTVGVAKRPLYGKIVEVKDRKAIIVNDKVVGYVLERGAQKLYVSVGNKISPEDAVAIVEMLWIEGHPLPEPLRLADEVSRRCSLPNRAQ